jgi:hypothetical protein
MDGVVFRGTISSGEFEDDGGAAWVRGEEGSYVPDVAVKDYPAGLWDIMFCNYQLISIYFIRRSTARFIAGMYLLQRRISATFSYNQKAVFTEQSDLLTGDVDKALM